MASNEQNKRARGCLVIILKLGLLALGVFLLVRERFDAILQMVNPYWWTLSVLLGVVVLFMLARWIYRQP